MITTPINAHCSVDYAANGDRKLILGSFFLLAGAAISWR